RGVLSLPDQSGRDLSRALSRAELQRQSRDPARYREEIARSQAAPLRGAGADLSSGETKEDVASGVQSEACPLERTDIGDRMVGTALCAFASPRSVTTTPPAPSDLPRRRPRTGPAGAARSRRSGARG